MTTTPINTGLGMMAASPLLGTRGTGKSDQGDANWFQSLAEAWGRTLDGEAAKISGMSDQISGGQDNPSDITKLTAESMRMSFLSNSSSSSIDSVGKSLETMARKS